MKIEPGIYRHYKQGHKYQVLGTAEHTETLETVVVYKPLYVIVDGPDVDFFVRGVEMFSEEVELDGKKMKRFERIE